MNNPVNNNLAPNNNQIVLARKKQPEIHAQGTTRQKTILQKKYTKHPLDRFNGSRPKPPEEPFAVKVKRRIKNVKQKLYNHFATYRYTPDYPLGQYIDILI